MKIFLLIASALIFFVTPLVQADVIRCKQTEPFISETFNTDNGTASVESPDLEQPNVESGLKFIITGVGKFEIRTADGSLRRLLVLNNKGSDGMSDLNFPFDGGVGINGPIGCESSELKAKE